MVPARSAAEYPQKLQQKAIMMGLKSFAIHISSAQKQHACYIVTVYGYQFTVYGFFIKLCSA